MRAPQAPPHSTSHRGGKARRRHPQLLANIEQQQAPVCAGAAHRRLRDRLRRRLWRRRRARHDGRRQRRRRRRRRGRGQQQRRRRRRAGAGARRRRLALAHAARAWPVSRGQKGWAKRAVGASVAVGIQCRVRRALLLPVPQTNASPKAPLPKARTAGAEADEQHDDERDHHDDAGHHDCAPTGGGRGVRAS